MLPYWTGQDAGISHPHWLQVAEAKFLLFEAEKLRSPFLFSTLTNRMEAQLHAPQAWQAQKMEETITLSPAPSEGVRAMLGRQAKEMRGHHAGP